MKNMFKSNKKGFTLVELLAVIVILALLIVITANTVLPMMNKSKKNAMVVYTERVLNTASASFQADSITSENDEEAYSIAELMGEDDYFGCVKVAKSSTGYTYDVKIYTNNDDLKYETTTALTSVTIDGKAEELALDYESSDSFSADSYESQSLCRTIYGVEVEEEE